MDSQEIRADHVDPSALTDRSGRASLQLELRVPDQHLLVSFRDTFLRWLTDRSGPFARAVGPSDRLSLDELPAGPENLGQPTLRLTVSWSLAPGDPGQAVAPVLWSDEPVPASTSLTRQDNFVFFPDPPGTGIPIYRELSVPLELGGWSPSQGRPQLRLAPPQLVAIGREAAAALQAAGSVVRRRAGALGMPGLTIRSQALASSPRSWALALLATAAVTTGFAAGSIYLAKARRPGPPPAVSGAPVTAPAPSTLTVSSELTGAPGASQVEPFVDAAGRIASAARREPLIVQKGAAGIADAEVTPAPAPRVAASGPTMLRRPAIVTVRASDRAGASAAPLRRGLGTLLVKSDPQGAEVSINGIVHGRTPLMIRELGAGSRVLRLNLPGYEPWSWAVGVVANKRTPVTVKLQRGAARDQAGATGATR